jgi:hypothetical protein
MKIIDQRKIKGVKQILHHTFLIRSPHFHVISECPAGTFGDKCSNPCKCADKLNCDKVKGTCVSEGCIPGWEGASCNKCKCKMTLNITY